MQTYKTLNVTTFNDLFLLLEREDRPKGLAGMAREYGEEKVHKVLCLVLVDLQSSFNVTNAMSETQIKEAATLIRSEFYFLTPPDFKMFANGAKGGKYGESYNRLDAATVLKWLRVYVQERMEAAEYGTQQAHKQLKEGEQMSPEQIQEFRDRFYRGADDLFQKIKDNDEAPADKEAAYQEWRKGFLMDPNRETREQKIARLEKELNQLKNA